jgi:NADPH2:quinone reductase
MNDSIHGIEGLRALLGQALPPSDWRTVSQEDVDQFAKLSGDHQWIHVDSERARRESPFGGPVAHGNLTLCIADGLSVPFLERLKGVEALVNYGFDRVRFPAPVPSGSRVRCVVQLVSLTEVGGGWWQLVRRVTVEREGHEKPAVVADSLVRIKTAASTAVAPAEAPEATEPPAPADAPRALVCRALTGPSGLRVERRAVAPLGDNGVRIRVEACGVNFADILVVKGQYQERPPLPFVPGAEVAGTIEACGPRVTAYRPGDRVLALVQHGGFAEVVVTDASTVFALPAGIDATHAAALPIAYGTAHGALVWRAALQQGETLLVLGAAGGVGLAAIEVGKALGARVIAAASSPEKLELARARGADEGIDYSREDLRERLKALTGGRGPNVVFDPVGGALFEPALRALAWKGRMVVIGFAAGQIPKVAANLLLVKNVTVTGLYWGAYLRNEPETVRAQLMELTSWLAAGRLKPHIGGTYPLERAAEALTALEQRRAVGKLIILPSAQP